MLYTETNAASYTVLGDQIQKVGTLLVPRYFVNGQGITTPLNYEKLAKSVKEQSTNINTNYNTYFVLSSKDFTGQPIERRSVQSVDAQLTTLIQTEQMNEIAAGVDDNHVSGLYVDLDLGVITSPQVMQQYSDWLSKFQTDLNERHLHLGLLVDPAKINDTNKELLHKVEMVYLGQSQSPINKQIEGIKYVSTVRNDSVIEVPTVSTKTDTRERSRSTINVEYRSVTSLLLNRSTDRSTPTVMLRDGTFDYQINDAVTAYNFMQKVNLVNNNKESTYAVSDPGFEEYTLWKMLLLNLSDETIPKLLSEESASELAINNSGQGQIVNITSQAEPGQRKLTFDGQSTIASSTLTKLDTANQVVSQGQLPKKVALTFDDGPDPVYTPKVMEILESYNVRGTFFVIGQNVLAYPETARMLVSHGHEIENHTFTHPVFSLLTKEANKSQMQATNDIIYEITGTHPQYFRKPYSDRNEATNTSDIAYLELLNELGLKASEYDIDSKDWMLESSDQIVEHVKAQFQASNGKYSQVLLHDSHQNPELTIEALPKIIEYIQSQGIEIVTVNHLADQSNNHPTVLSSTTPYRALRAQRGVLGVVTWVSILFIILSFIRYAWMIVGAIFYTIKRSMLRFLSNNMSLHIGTLPRLAVIIACYNEEMVIGKTIEALQNNTYRNFRLILVNDGSKDKTAEVIAEYAAKDKRITLINLPNGGKAKALEQGMARTKNKWLVFCDADTIFAPSALYEFALAATIDSRLGAIAGKILVGNDHNLLTRSQLIEYDIAYKFIKSSQDVTNMITVVPGAAGLWRHKALEKAGGFVSDTLAEDADTTMRVISQGSRVGYRANIRAYTEAPEKLKMLFKQRTRWQLGNMQSIFKHRKGLFNHRYGTLGFVGLPLFYLELLATVAYPFIMVFTFSMLFSQGSASLQRLKLVITNPTTDYAVSLGIVLVIIELVMVLFVVATAQKSWRAKLRLLITVPYFVTIYKFFLSLFTLVALFRALKGRMHGWGHLQRTASVSANS